MIEKKLCVRVLWVQNRPYRYSEPSCSLMLGDMRSLFLLPIMQCFCLFYCSVLRVLVAFDTYVVCVYKVCKDKAKKQYSLSIFQTPVVTCLARWDFRTYLPMFRENSWLFELVCTYVYSIKLESQVYSRYLPVQKSHPPDTTNKASGW